MIKIKCTSHIDYLGMVIRCAATRRKSEGFGENCKYCVLALACDPSQKDTLKNAVEISEEPEDFIKEVLNEN